MIRNSEFSKNRLDTLIAFKYLVECHSFSETARIVGKSQSTISQQLKDLERTLGGVTLINRTSQKFEVNGSGKLLYEAINEALDSLEEGFLKIIKKAKLNRYIVNLIASSIPGQYILPKEIMKFRKIHPKVQFSVKIQNSRDALRALQDETNNLCAIGGFQNENPNDFDVIPIDTDSIVIFARKNHPIFTKSDKFSELFNYPWILREEGSATRQEFLCKFPNHQNLSVVLELQDNTAIINAVEASDAISVMSFHLIQFTDDSKIREIKIKGLTPVTRQIYLAKIRGKRLDFYEQVFWDAFKGVK